MKLFKTNKNKKEHKKHQNEVVATPISMPNIMGSDNIIESDTHTLISVEQPAEMLPLMGEDGSILQGIYQEQPQFTLYKLYLSDFEDESRHGLHKIISKLQEANPEDVLELHIAGHGGYISEGLAFYNLISSLFRGRTSAYLTYGYSMNALAFLFADERIVYEHSEIMFHTYSAGFGGKRDDILSQIAHTDKHLQKFFKKILSPYFSEEEIQSMGSNKDFWLNSHEMLVRGIATGIIIDGEYLSRDDYFKKYKKNGKLRKKWLKENKENKDGQSTV